MGKLLQNIIKEGTARKILPHFTTLNDRLGRLQGGEQTPGKVSVLPFLNLNSFFSYVSFAKSPFYDLLGKYSIPYSDSWNIVRIFL